MGEADRILDVARIHGEPQLQNVLWVSGGLNFRDTFLKETLEMRSK
jgi:hypothetical protein